VSTESGGVHGTRVAQLGSAVPQEPQPKASAWLRQTFHVHRGWERPVLSFSYRITANDTIDGSDLLVSLTRTDGTLLADVLRDGFRSCETPASPPPAGTDLGWRYAIYDLTPLRGENVRLVLKNRNLHDEASLGIWTQIDDVRVRDLRLWEAGPYHVYLPSVDARNAICDPVVTRVASP
jgi:hypothetical protein